MEASIIAAFFLGPKVLIPASRNTSATPAASGSSGATITKSTSFSLAKARSFSASITDMSTHSAYSAIPAFPGAA